MSEQLDELYQEIADVLVDIIPEPWKKILLYAEFQGVNENVFFYYYPMKKGEPVFSGDIPVKYKVNQDLHVQLFEELQVCFKQLWIDTRAGNDDPWTSTTFMLLHDGQMNIAFNYDDISQLSAQEKHEAWVEEHIK